MPTHGENAIREIMAIASLDELRAVSDSVNAQWKMLRQMGAIQAVISNGIAMGVQVEWTSKRKYGTLIRGTVLKVGSKNAKVRAEDGVLWTVALEMLRKAA